MMIVQMDNLSAPSSRECAQHLYDKNIELENKRRRSALERIPSDHNVWNQMRENYETIVLEDHGFSEQHNIEYALWQLHYRRIEELRAHFSAALASANSNTSRGSKVSTRPDHVTKIRLQFKTFLSEATGFYHDLILKIRAKYGLPLGYFSEDLDSQVVSEKDGKKSEDMKKGLISCHRCLIYLGDLARYKGLYGEADSKSREYAAASSYYLQAASLWPSSGNPHHQLAILASYSEDELVAVYRYFRSLAITNPFVTARDNLIVAFEKNRQCYTQLLGDVKVPVVKDSSVPLPSKGRGKREAKPVAKDTAFETNSENEKSSKIHEMYKSFCICFVRLNGILFTRTSLETFGEVLSSVSNEFRQLLSTGPEEELNFGLDTVDNALFIVRVISILIFTVHNVKREAEGQTYAEIVQRAVLLQNAFTAVFELICCMLERFVQLQDPSSSFLLPGILVFVEWLACCPDVASDSDADEKQTAVRLNFWKNFISFLNKVLSFWSRSLDDNEDDACFNNLSPYEEGETGNRLALWEDFELRGFLPILPAQTILDFSRKRSFGTDGSKGKLARAKRILAAGKALANIAKIDQKAIVYDSRMKKFVIVMEPQISDNGVLTLDSGLPKGNKQLQEIQSEQAINLGVLRPNPQLHMEGDEEDEVIVFRPAVIEKQNDVLSSKWTPYDGMRPSLDLSAGDMKFCGGKASPALDMQQQAPFGSGLQISVSSGVSNSLFQAPVQLHTSKWLMEEAVSLANSFKAVGILENGFVAKQELSKDLGVAHPPACSFPIQQTANANFSGMLCNQSKVLEIVATSKEVSTASGGVTECLAATTSAGMRKSPVARPVRHLGPPPGFSHLPSNQIIEPVLGSDLTCKNSLADDYSWLDGYQFPSSTKGPEFHAAVNVISQAMPRGLSNNNGFTGTVSFPFPGKQVPSIQHQTGNQYSWQNYQSDDHRRVLQEQELQQRLLNGNQHFTPMPEQYHGNSIWSGRYLV